MGQFQKENGKKDKKSENSFKSSKIFSISSLDDIKRVFDYLHIDYFTRYEKDSAVEFIRLEDACPRCGFNQVVEVHYLDKRASWCCNRCRELLYGKVEKGQTIRMKDFYTDHPNDFEGLLSFLGYEPDDTLCDIFDGNLEKMTG
jgi:ribosomal protein S27AE